jgi:hypothetical protein
MSRSARSSMSSLNSVTQSAMKRVDSSLKPVGRALNGNKVVSNSIIVVLVIYAVLIAPNLSLSVARVFDNTLFRVVFILVIAVVCLVDPIKALLLAICFVVSVQRLHNLKKASVPAANLGNNISNVINAIQQQAQQLIQQGQQMLHNGNIDGQDLVKQGNNLLNQTIEAQQEAEEEAAEAGVNLNVVAANNAVQQQAVLQQALQDNNNVAQQVVEEHAQQVAAQQQAQNPVHNNVQVANVQGGLNQINIGELLNNGASEDPSGDNFAQVAQQQVSQQASQQVAQQGGLNQQQQQAVAQQVNDLSAQAQALTQQASQEQSAEVVSQLNARAQQLNNRAQQLATTYFTSDEDLQSSQSRNVGCPTTPREIQSQKLQLGPQSLISQVHGAPTDDQFAQF